MAEKMTLSEELGNTRNRFATIREDNDLDGYMSLRGMEESNTWHTDEFQEMRLHVDRLIWNEPGWGSRPWRRHWEEATQSDMFPLALGDTLNRSLNDAFQATPPVMRQLFETRGVPDLTRSAKMLLEDGRVKRLQHVPEGDSYDDDTEPSEEQKTVTPQKHGRITPISLEAILADDLTLFQRLPNQLAQSARNTEEWKLTTMFYNSAGPLDSVYNATAGTDFGGGFGQQGVASTALSVPNLETAIEEMMEFANSMSEPILNDVGALLVSPSNMITAQKILNSAVLQGNTDDLPTSNQLPRFGIKVLTNPWLPVVVTTGTIAATTWALFSRTISPGQFVTVNGHETPELFIRTSNAQRIGGGGTNPLDGSFENDTIAYKVRYMFNAMSGDPRSTWASDGQ